MIYCFFQVTSDQNICKYSKYLDVKSSHTKLTILMLFNVQTERRIIAKHILAFMKALSSFINGNLRSSKKHHIYDENIFRFSIILF